MSIGDIYCEQIITRKIPFKVFAESPQVLAFYHTKPYWPLHIVVVPKIHIDSLLVLNQKHGSLILELMETIQKVGQFVTNGYGACRILTNLGTYQDSHHLHFHISFGNPLL